MNIDRQAVQAALAYVRWQAFGDCRTEGWDGPPPTASELDTLLAAALRVEPIANLLQEYGLDVALKKQPEQVETWQTRRSDLIRHGEDSDYIFDAGLMQAEINELRAKLDTLKQSAELYYKRGWITAALWAKRDDLISDIDSNAYAECRDAAIKDAK